MPALAPTSARTPAGLAVRIAQRILAPTLGMLLNTLNGRPARVLAAYDGRSLRRGLRHLSQCFGSGSENGVSHVRFSARTEIESLYGFPRSHNLRRQET